MAKTFSAAAARALQTAGGKSESHTKMVKAVRAACRRLGIDDADRRAIQKEATGKQSLSDMTLPEMGKVLDQLNKGWKGPLGHRGHIGKIRALWWTLYWIGAVDQPNDDAMNAFIARQTGKLKIQFLAPKEAFKVIEALKAWAVRKGVTWPDQARLAELQKVAPHLTLATIDRWAVAEAIAVSLRLAGRMHSGWIGYCEKGLRLGINHHDWTDRQLDDCIRLLGKMLRRHLEKRGEA